MRAVIALVTLAWAAPAAAQPMTDSRPAFSIERLTPPPGEGTFFEAQDADVLPRWAWTFRILGTLMSRPIVLRDIIDGREISEPVSLRLGYDLGAAVGVGSRFQLGLALPVVAAQDGDRLRGIDLDETGLRPVTVGDLRLHAKGRLAGEPGDLGMGLGGAVTITLPTGDQEHFAGEAGAVVEWQLIASYRTRWWRAALDVGPRFRTERVVLLSPARPHDNELEAAIAGELVVPGIPRRMIGLLGEYAVVRGDAAAGAGSSRGPSPQEARIGLRLRTASGWSVIAGAGWGTTPDEVGAPKWRAILGARFEMAPNSDIDGDGVADRADRCRLRAEDRDGWLDLDGCPDEDNDADGLPDAIDECPNKPEDRDRIQDLDGCPEG